MRSMTYFSSLVALQKLFVLLELKICGIFTANCGDSGIVRRAIRQAIRQASRPLS